MMLLSKSPEGEQTTKDGQAYINLGKQKRAGITTFKGSTYVDIREYYGPADDEKPGKKGISLNKDQVCAVVMELWLVPKRPLSGKS